MGTTARHKLVILGAGPAGLAIGHYANKAGLDYTIYEAQNRSGGNCITLQQGEFLYDSGAHRFHDKDPEATREIKSLLGSELRQIDIPSQIWHEGRMFDFPISPFNLLKTLGLVDFTRALFSLARGRLAGRSASGSFQDFALRTYGADIASRFLLNYSEKLWGAPCDQLSPAICGARLKGLNLASLLKEAIVGRVMNTRHLDGSFYYPRQGFGVIADRLAQSCGHERIRLESRVTRLVHDGDCIRLVEINGGEKVPVEQLASTLPVGLTLKLLTPSPPADILERCASLRYRNVVLAAVFLKKERITANGSVYFPDPSFPFTRVYEPRNRSPEMSPPGQTSLVAEFPCQPGDAVWAADESTLLKVVCEHFERIGWIRPGDVIGGKTHRMPHAYPILELGYEARLAPVAEYLSQFRNLRLAGRNGCFVYSHLHDMMRHGKEVVAGFEKQAATDAPAGIPHEVERRQRRAA